MLTYKLGTSAATYKGAFFLNALDERMEKSGLFYVRFMDDILVLAPTRWKLRRAVKAVNEVLGSLRMEKHPDKTFIGRIERGFDFLGYHFGPDGLSVAKKTVENFVARAIRLYEQEPGEAGASSRVGAYVRRWVRWAEAGLDEAWEGGLRGSGPPEGYNGSPARRRPRRLPRPDEDLRPSKVFRSGTTWATASRSLTPAPLPSSPTSSNSKLPL
ncbi:MAG: hypothetical protein IIA23_12320 [Chloroflexi bacterium]|nr:hypothetical protein [Chloroflexota bacterium]